MPMNGTIRFDGAGGCLGVLVAWWRVTLSSWTSHRHRCNKGSSPSGIISHCVWQYHRHPFSFRKVDEMMTRGVVVSHETIRGCRKFAESHAARSTFRPLTCAFPCGWVPKMANLAYQLLSQRSGVTSTCNSPSSNRGNILCSRRECRESISGCLSASR